MSGKSRKQSARKSGSGSSKSDEKEAEEEDEDEVPDMSGPKQTTTKADVSATILNNLKLILNIFLSSP